MTPPDSSAAAAVKPIPDGYPIVSPYLCVAGGAEAIEFYKKAFGATERMRMVMPGGKIGHAELMVAGGLIMLADEFPEMNFRSPRTVGGASVTIHIYVPNVDALAAQAEAAGVKVLRPVATQFYGDRSVSLECPFGHFWNFSTHVEDISPEEMDRRSKAMSEKGC